MPLGFGPDGIPGTSDDSTLPEGDFTERFEYDSLGREILHVSFEGAVTQSVYDDSAGAGGRLSEQKFFDNLTDYNNGSGTPSQVTVYDYDPFGHQFKVVQDADGNLNTTSDERITDTVYNGEGQIVSITSPEGIVNYEYDPVTGLQTRTYTGTINSPIDDTRYTFDALGRLSTVEVYERNGVMVDVDPNTDGNQPEVTRGTEKGTSLISSKGYDVENRWIGENIFSPLSPGEGQGEGVPLTVSDLSQRYLWQPNAVDQLMADEHVHLDANGKIATAELLFALTDQQGTGQKRGHH